MTRTRKTSKTDKPFRCMECGKRLSLRQAERASYGPNGCPRCGSSDIDEANYVRDACYDGESGGIA